MMSTSTPFYRVFSSSADESLYVLHSIDTSRSSEKGGAIYTKTDPVSPLLSVRLRESSTDQTLHILQLQYFEY